MNIAAVTFYTGAPPRKEGNDLSPVLDESLYRPDMPTHVTGRQEGPLHIPGNKSRIEVCQRYTRDTSMTAVTIEYDDQLVRAALNRLLSAGGDLSPVMAEIAGHMEASTRKAFRDERSPDGTKWPALSETTKKRRRKSGHTPIRFLEQSGDLASSLQADSDATSAIVGTNLPYATTHQFGASKGEFGSFSVIARVIRGKHTRLKSSPKVQVPWGNIPARPFLGVSEKDREQIVDTLNDYLAAQWR